MKKRYFPKKFTQPKFRRQPKLRVLSRVEVSASNNNCKNLRHEFDILIREKHTLLSDDQIGRLWHTIGTQILKAPQITLKEHIDNLDI